MLFCYIYCVCKCNRFKYKRIKKHHGKIEDLAILDFDLIIDLIFCDQ